MQEREAVRPVKNRNTAWGESVAKAAVCMRETGDKSSEKIQGHMPPTSDLGMRECADPPVLEPERGINNNIYETRIAGNEGWNPQNPCPPMWMANEAASMMCGCVIVM